MESPANRVMNNAHHFSPAKFSTLWFTQIKPTIKAAAVGLGTPTNQRLSALPVPIKVLNRARRRGRAGAIDKGDGIADFAEVEKLPFVGNQCGGRRRS